MVRMLCYQQAGNLEGCRSTAELLEKRDLRDAGSLYDAACCRAILAAVQAKAPGADAARLAQEECDKAMAWLNKAVAAGFRDPTLIRKKYLESLRDREDVKKLLAELEDKGQ